MKPTKTNNIETGVTESINRAHCRELDISGLKLWAEENLPRSSPIRSILLLERGSLTVEEFIAKMDIWLKLVDMVRSTMK